MGISEKTNLVLEIKTQEKFDEVLKQDHITVLVLKLVLPDLYNVFDIYCSIY